MRDFLDGPPGKVREECARKCLREFCLVTGSDRKWKIVSFFVAKSASSGSDPAFSTNDTLEFYNHVVADDGYRQKAQTAARLRLISGLVRCGGGQETNEFDAFNALEPC